MANIIIENIVASVEIADNFDIEYLADKLDNVNYNPDEFHGLVIKFTEPRIAALLIANGNIVFTGAKEINEIETVLQKVILGLKNIGIEIGVIPKIKIDNIVASFNLNVEIDLAYVAENFSINKDDYKPEEFPGLIYKKNDIEGIMILFKSGKIVCTGVKKIEEIDNAVEEMKEKLTKIGVL